MTSAEMPSRCLPHPDCPLAHLIAAARKGGTDRD